MGAAELGETATQTGARGYASTLSRVYASLWAATSLAAVGVAALGLGAPVRHGLGLRLSPDATTAPSLITVLELAAHNLPVCGWPLLLAAAGADRSHRRRRFARGMVFAALGVNVSLVGVALGAYGTRLLPYVPQLPLEWLGLAAGAAGWVSATTRTDRRARTIVAAATAAAVLAAAVVETYAVPHSSGVVAGGVKRRLAATYG